MDSIDKLRSRNPQTFDLLVKEIRKAGTDNLSHFGNGYCLEGGYSLQQNPDEFAALVVHLGSKARASLVEIGSASGGTARFLHEQVGFERILSLDNGGHHRYPELAANFEKLPVYHFKGDSHSAEAKRFLDEHLRGYVDVAFIDGDHTYEGAWADVQLMRDYWETGTLVVLHDIIACGGVKKVWERGRDEGLWVPLAEYVGKERPLGIAVGYAL